ncbi:MAG: GGDEF domain-containing protein [Clostridia bacterium]|nr:GGDEF domain-containing protein [Clostridia bacterium]
MIKKILSYISGSFANTTITNKYYRFYLVINYTSIIGFIAHASFIPLFAFLEVKFLVFVNILSCISYAVCFFLNRKGKQNISFFIGIIEVVIHAVLATYFLGWNSGFHMYVICLIPLLFYASTICNTAKKLLIITLSLVYLFMNYFSLNTAPVIILPQTPLSRLNYMNISMCFVVLALLSYYYSKAASKFEDKLKSVNKELEFLAFTDPLTGLHNRRRMLDEIENQIQFSRMSSKPFTLIIGDIDDFKNFNDEHTHDCGDFILVHIAAIMKKIVDTKGKIARWGGEEFMIVLPDTDLAKGKEIAEALRKEICSDSASYHGNKLFVSITFGICEYKRNLKVQDIISIADKYLYIGKKSGKNCVMG